jgi:hypothetical protein
MKAVVSLKGKQPKGESRSIHNFVQKLHMDAVEPRDHFLLAAIGRALFGGPNDAQELRQAIVYEAIKCRDDHNRANLAEPKDDSEL